MAQEWQGGVCDDASTYLSISILLLELSIVASRDLDIPATAYVGKPDVSIADTNALVTKRIVSIQQILKEPERE